MSNKFASSMDMPRKSLKVAKGVMRLSTFTRDPVLLVGETGVAKTSAQRQEAGQNDFNYDEFNPYFHDPEELSGPMWPLQSGDGYKHIPPDRLPTGDDDTKLWLNIEEINRAEDHQIQPIMPLLSKRRIGSHQLGPNVVIHSTMNPPEGDYNVSNMINRDPAMRQRVCQVFVKFIDGSFIEYTANPSEKKKIREMPEAKLDHEFLDGLNDEPWHPAIRHWFQENPNEIMNVQARRDGKLFSNPSSLEKVNRTLKVIDHFEGLQMNKFLERCVRTKIAGHIGQSNTSELMDFVLDKKENYLPPEDVLEHYLEKGEEWNQFQEMIQEQNNMRLSILVREIGRMVMEKDDEERFDYIDTIAEISYDLPSQFKNALNAAIMSNGRREDGGFEESAMRFKTKLTSHDKYRQKTVEEMEDRRKMEDQLEENMA